MFETASPLRLTSEALKLAERGTSSRKVTFRLRGASVCLSDCDARRESVQSDSNFGLSDHQLAQLFDRTRAQRKSQAPLTFRMRGATEASDGEFLSDARPASDSDFGISDEQLAEVARSWTVSRDSQAQPMPQLAATFHAQPTQPFNHLGLGLRGRACRELATAAKKLQTLEEFIGSPPAPLTTLEEFLGVSL